MKHLETSAVYDDVSVEAKLQAQFPELFFRTYDVILLLLILNSVLDVRQGYISIGTLSLTVLLAFVSVYAFMIVRRFILHGAVVQTLQGHVTKVARMTAIFSSMCIGTIGMIVFAMTYPYYDTLQLGWGLLLIGVISVALGVLIFMRIRKKVTFTTI